MKKSSCLKPQGLELWYLVCSITLWFSTQFVLIMTLGPKMALPRGHMFYTGLYKEKRGKIVLSKTTRPKAEASPCEPLASLFKLYPWGQKWPAPGVTCFIYIGLYKEKHEKIFLSETIRLRALIFGM